MIEFLFKMFDLFFLIKAYINRGSFIFQVRVFWSLWFMQSVGYGSWQKYKISAQYFSNYTFKAKKTLKWE